LKRSIRKTRLYLRRFIILIIPVISFLTISIETIAQEPPPRPIVVTTTQGLSFGAFYHGAVGGTITINTDGSRTSTGDVVPLGLGIFYSRATYEIVANPGTIISLVNGPDVILIGSPGGGTLSLHIGDPDLGVSFVTTEPYPIPTELNVGGTLTVGNSITNPPGSYSGTFDITFNQE
jgi:hypothetical protein